ncbi:MAG: hypothetical protein ACR2PL_27340 [Dehalococcoidia bacterium]
MSLIMPALTSLPFVPGEEYEVYFVFITLILAFVVLIVFGSYWQK